MKRLLTLALATLACARGGDDLSYPDKGLHLDATGERPTHICGKMTLEAVRKVPTVALLLDQSRSMSERFEGDLWRWHVLRDTLVGTDGVVRLFEGKIRFGATLYQSATGLKSSRCPMLTHATAGFAFDATTIDIQKLFDDHIPGGDTPTAESMDAVTTQLAPLTTEGPKFIVLATDGEPDTCAVPNPQQGQAQAIAATQLAFARGIPTMVIGITTDVSREHLQDMANAGAGLPIGGAEKAKFFSVDDRKGLKGAFDTFVKNATECAFKLSGRVLDSSQGTVKIIGEEGFLTRASSDGWQVLDEDTLVIYGAACEKLKNNRDAKLEVTFPCNVVLR
jgi:hypothetical protein